MQIKFGKTSAKTRSFSIAYCKLYWLLSGENYVRLVSNGRGFLFLVLFIKTHF